MSLVNGAAGPSDIKGKTTRVAASECGQRTSFNRTREAGHLDEIQGVVANTLNLHRNGASLLANTFGVGFIGWLDLSVSVCVHINTRIYHGTCMRRDS